MEQIRADHRAWYELARTQLEAGAQDEALATVQKAFDERLLWRLGLLDDPAFDPLRRRREFQRVASDAAKRVKRLKLKPAVLCLPPANGDRRPPLVVGLHGANSSAAALIEDWRSAGEAGYMVAAVQSSQPVTEHSFCWDEPEQVRRDLGWAADRIRTDYRFDPDRVLVAGFSQGAAVAVRLALTQAPIPVRGFLLAAPALGRGPAAEPRSQRGIRGAAVLGGDDPWAANFAVHEQRWRKAGIELRVERFPGLGHSYPEGFAELLPELLGWAMG